MYRNGILLLLALVLLNCNPTYGFQLTLLHRRITKTSSFSHKFPPARLFNKNVATERLIGFKLHVSKEYETILDDMLYSGEMNILFNRYNKIVMNENFLSFVSSKIESANEEDEVQVMMMIKDRIKDRLRKSEGLENPEEVFEKRLDTIVFTAPKYRKEYITEHLEEMSEGFICFVKDVLQKQEDLDSKVVLASILQLIGQAKNVDLLGQYSNLLNYADSTLGDEFGQKNEDFESSVLVGNRNEQASCCALFL